MFEKLFIRIQLSLQSALKLCFLHPIIYMVGFCFLIGGLVISVQSLYALLLHTLSSTSIIAGLVFGPYLALAGLTLLLRRQQARLLVSGIFILPVLFALPLKGNHLSIPLVALAIAMAACTFGLLSNGASKRYFSGC